MNFNNLSILHKFSSFYRSGTIFFLLLLSQTIVAQSLQVTSPNGKIKATLAENKDSAGKWLLQVSYDTAGRSTEVFSAISLGLVRNDESFESGLKLVKADKPTNVTDIYTALHGKRSQCSNQASERVFTLMNRNGSLLEIMVRAYNDGLAFRYGFPEKKSGQYTMMGESTTYAIASRNERWLQGFVSSYEDYYNNQKGDIRKGEWNYPALFTTPGNTCWALITEAGINGENRGGSTQLTFSFLPAGKKYRLTLIADGDNDMAFDTHYSNVSADSVLDVKWLPRGGFSIYLQPF